MVMKAVPDQPGIFRADWRPEAAGVYQLGTTSGLPARPVVLRVDEQQREWMHPEMNRVLLESLCRESGGRFWALDETTPNAVLEQILADRPRLDMSVAVTPWDTVVALALVMLCFVNEWFFRRWYYLD
jgi:hypothetical protein